MMDIRMMCKFLQQLTSFLVVFMAYPQITVSPDGTGVTTISPISFMGDLLLSC